jgi:hypothetical protein
MLSLNSITLEITSSNSVGYGFSIFGEEGFGSFFWTFAFNFMIPTY